jgi:chromosome segregation ATPase
MGNVAEESSVHVADSNNIFGIIPVKTEPAEEVPIKLECDIDSLPEPVQEAEDHLDIDQTHASDLDIEVKRAEWSTFRIAHLEGLVKTLRKSNEDLANNLNKEHIEKNDALEKVAEMRAKMQQPKTSLRNIKRLRPKKKKKKKNLANNLNKEHIEKNDALEKVAEMRAKMQQPKTSLRNIKRLRPKKKKKNKKIV